jgi:hypothetical protein
MAREEDGFFDDLARGLGDGSITRGKALRLMGAALVGGALASLPGAALADDDCRSFGRRCRRDSQCCSKNCVRRGDNKVCGCPEGQRRCNDRCVNLNRNENHCGTCSNRCDEGEQCMEGVCQGACPPDTQICGASCCTADELCWSDGDIGQIAICCSTDPFCGGILTVAGEQVCVELAVLDDCAARPTCNTDAECSSGEVCGATFCDPQYRCLPPC